jgi:hypothetical protein
LAKGQQEQLVVSHDQCCDRVADKFFVKSAELVDSDQMAGYPSQLNEKGYAVIPGFLGAAELGAIVRFVSDLNADGAGTRRLIELPWCSGLAERLLRDERLSGVFPVEAVPVQCSLFVKSMENNWLVPLHQDLSVPVAERVASPGCQGWSEKEGELFVQPPVSVLEGVVALRLHLDDCNERNGALRVVPGSHRLGRLTADEASRMKRERGEVAVQVARAGLMVMKPLLLHASSKATIGGVRRVLHFVFGARDLSGGLRWPATKLVAGCWSSD